MMHFSATCSQKDDPVSSSLVVIPKSSSLLILALYRDQFGDGCLLSIDMNEKFAMSNTIVYIITMIQEVKYVLVD